MPGSSCGQLTGEIASNGLTLIWEATVAKQDDRKKQKKRLKEQKRAADQARFLAAKQRRDRYPEILFDTTEGDKEFVQLVKEALGSLDFDSPEMGPNWMRQFYQNVKIAGFKHAYIALLYLADRQVKKKVFHPQSSPILPAAPDLVSGVPEPEDECVDPDAVLLHLGDRIFRKLGRDALHGFLPYNDFSVETQGRSLLLRFSSLQSQIVRGARVYFSRHRPQVAFNGQKWTVAFSIHAIEQMCRRRAPLFDTFGGNGDAHAYFANSLHFDPVRLATGKLAFCMFDGCDYPGCRVHEDYVVNVLGQENRLAHAGECYYRLGYCPVMLEQDFAIARTLLMPGFRTTPEEGVLKGRQAPPRYLEWMGTAEDTYSEHFYVTAEYTEILKWVHDHGVPQVIQMTNPVVAADPTKWKPRLRFGSLGVEDFCDDPINGIAPTQTPRGLLARDYQGSADKLEQLGDLSQQGPLDGFFGD